MAINKELGPNAWELIDHRDNTMGELVKGYTVGQLSFMDKIDTSKVYYSGKYIPIRIDSAIDHYKYKQMKRKIPYRILRIRMDEVKSIFTKRNRGKKIVYEAEN